MIFMKLVKVSDTNVKILGVRYMNPSRQARTGSLISFLLGRMYIFLLFMINPNNISISFAKMRQKV